MIKSAIFFILLFSCCTLNAKFDLQIEGGAVWQNRNDFQIPPNDNGSRVELDELSGDGPFLHYRAELFYRPSENHGFRAVWAPFSVDVSFTPQSSVDFNGTRFLQGSPVQATYTFNSYRATYFYAFLGQKSHQLNLGFTAKIRQAEIALQQNGQARSYDNVGFVPLIYFEYQLALSQGWLMNFQFDGLAGGPGRAFDLALKIRRTLSDSLNLGFGYRTIEGGADNDKVFTFSWLNYAVVELQAHF